MSIPPRRWLDGDEPSDLARSLLDAGARLSLDPDRRARLWQSIAAQLPPPGGPAQPPEGTPPAAPPAPPAPPPPAPLAVATSAEKPLAPSGASGYPPPLSSSLLSSAGAKTAAYVAALGLTALGGYWMTEPVGLSPRRPVAVAPSAPESALPAALPPALPTGSAPTTATAAAPPAPGASDPTPAVASMRRAPELPVRAPSSVVESPTGPAPEAPPVEAPAPSASAPALTPAEVAALERTNRLKEEAAMVVQARAALRAGNASEALRGLAEIQQRFGGGGMGQEREALTIEALAQSGQREQARARAEAFLRAHPSSPHATELRRFVP